MLGCHASKLSVWPPMASNFQLFQHCAYPRLHGLDGFPKCHLSTQRDLAHLPSSSSTSSCHLPHTLSTSFYLCLYLFSLPPLYFCKLIPNHRIFTLHVSKPLSPQKPLLSPFFIITAVVTPVY